MAAWLAEKKGTAASTQKFYQNSTKKFLLHLGPLANEELSMIARDHVLSFRNSMRETLSPKAVNHHLKVVKMVFRSARRDGYIIDAPSEFVQTVREKTGTAKRRRPFTSEEIRAVFAVADDAPLHPKAFALMAEKGKSGTLSNRFADILALAGLREKKPHRGSAGEGRAGRHQLEALSFHSLRHTAVTFLKEAGIPAAVVQKFIGHESAQISDLYTSVGTESLVKAATAFPRL